MVLDCRLLCYVRAVVSVFLDFSCRDPAVMETAAPVDSLVSHRATADSAGSYR